MIKKEIFYIGAEFGAGAGTIGCEKAPCVISDNIPQVKNKMATMITMDNSKRRKECVDNLAESCKNLARAVYEQKQKNHFPIVIGGDHSSGFGTWSGATKDEGDYGVLWVDAHFDLHTFETSDSSNPHGMPVAGLMGYGDNRLTNILYNGIKVKPENVAFIGTRCYESKERELAEKLNIKVFYAEEVKKVGFAKCFQSVISSFQNKGIKFGISFDMDCLDVQEITAVGTPVKNGLILNDVMDSFNNTNLEGLDVLEVVEYNPQLDKTGNYIKVVKKVLSCFDKNILI